MAKNNTKTIIYIVGGILIIGGLFAWPIINDKNRPIVAEWKKAGINCLYPNVQVGKHVHPSLRISVDGEEESFDQDLGIARGCMSEFHVHKGQPGVLHLETVSATKEFKLSDFTIIYGKPLMREGYNLAMKLDGVEYTGDPADLILADKQIIELDYSSIAQ